MGGALASKRWRELLFSKHSMGPEMMLISYKVEFVVKRYQRYCLAIRLLFHHCCDSWPKKEGKVIAAIAKKKKKKKSVRDLAVPQLKLSLFYEYEVRLSVPVAVLERNPTQLLPTNSRKERKWSCDSGPGNKVFFFCRKWQERRSPI